MDFLRTRFTGRALRARLVGEHEVYAGFDRDGAGQATGLPAARKNRATSPRQEYVAGSGSVAADLRVHHAGSALAQAAMAHSVAQGGRQDRDDCPRPGRPHPRKAIPSAGIHSAATRLFALRPVHRRPRQVVRTRAECCDRELGTRGDRSGCGRLTTCSRGPARKVSSRAAGANAAAHLAGKAESRRWPVPDV